MKIGLNSYPIGLHIKQGGVGVAVVLHFRLLSLTIACQTVIKP